MTSQVGSRSKKAKMIFMQFDKNGDGGLNREEMGALVLAVNPRVKFREKEINEILDCLFQSYGEFIDGKKGLTFDGLLRAYDDEAGDLDRDFGDLGLELEPLEDKNGAPRASEPWAAYPNHVIVFVDSCKLVDDPEILFKRFKAKQLKNGKNFAKRPKTEKTTGLLDATLSYFCCCLWDRQGK